MSKNPLGPYNDNCLYWLESDPGCRATWICDRLFSMGFACSSKIFKRKV